MIIFHIFCFLKLYHILSKIFSNLLALFWWDLKEAFALATRFAKRVTFSHYDWEVSRKIIQKNRRIGISMSGIQDWLLNNLSHRVVTGFEDAIDAETGENIAMIYQGNVKSLN